jgi:hypothetical protein
MATTSENKLTGPNGCEFFTKTWTPATPPVAQVVSFCSSSRAFACKLRAVDLYMKLT